MIGDAGLLTALHDHGYVINDTNPDYVVVGEGRLINFEVLEKALNLIMKELILDPTLSNWRRDTTRLRFYSSLSRNSFQAKSFEFR